MRADLPPKTSPGGIASCGWGEHPYGKSWMRSSLLRGQRDAGEGQNSQWQQVPWQPQQPNPRRWLFTLWVPLRCLGSQNLALLHVQLRRVFLWYHPSPQPCLWSMPMLACSSKDLEKVLAGSTASRHVPPSAALIQGMREGDPAPAGRETWTPVPDWTQCPARRALSHCPTLSPSSISPRCKSFCLATPKPFYPQGALLPPKLPDHP